MAIDSTTKPSWLVELEENGVCVVPNVIPIEACREFQESALKWLESFGRGFDRDDTSTWKAEHLPKHFAGGLYGGHGVNHEAWMWKVRSQPGIQKVFEQVWGDNDLIVSFDACNISLPINAKGRKDIETTKPWPHMDQNPRLVHQRQEIQGIANMYHSGPDDGGLVVVKASHKLHRGYFDSIGKFPVGEDAAPGQGGHGFDYPELQWYTQNGGDIIKVCANEGDLILWDSRTIHWNCSPTGDRTRFASYVAYAPRSHMSESELEKKLDVFRQRIPTGHVAAQNPDDNIRKRRIDADIEDGAKVIPARPKQEPEETKEILRLVGLRA